MKTLIQKPFSLKLGADGNTVVFCNSKPITTVLHVNYDTQESWFTSTDSSMSWDCDGNSLDGNSDNSLICFTWDEEPSKEILIDKGYIQILSGGEANTPEEIQPSMSFYTAPEFPYTDADVETILADETEKKLLVRLVWNSTDDHLRNIQNNIELHNILVPNKPAFLYKYGYCSDYYQNIISLLGAIKQDTSPLSSTVVIELYKAIDECLSKIYAENYPVTNDEISTLSSIELQTYAIAMDLVCTNLMKRDWEERITEIITELNSRDIIEDDDGIEDAPDSYIV